MIRRLLLDREPPPTDEWAFRWRSRDVSRIEGLSDAVFGFALTLIIVSLEVPQTSGELLRTMSGFVGFAVSFGFLFLVWKMQFTFFRRYGLDDNTTIYLTGAMLFFVLFFIYPLKFLIGATWRVAMHVPGASHAFAHGDLVWVIEIYALGLSGLLATITLLYGHAYRQRARLELTELEAFDTLGAVAGCATAVGIGVATSLVAPTLAIPKSSPWELPGLLLYVSVISGAAAVAAIVATRVKRKRKLLIARLTEVRDRG